MPLDTEIGGDSADAYEDVAAFLAWAESLGYSVAGSPEEPVEQAIRRGTVAMDGRYRGRWKGTKTYDGQARDWPRTDVADEDGAVVDDETIPIRIIHASFEFARRELETQGSMAPDLTRGGAVKRERSKVGPLEEEIEYMDGSSPMTVFTAIDDLLSGYLKSSNVSFLLRA